MLTLRVFAGRAIVIAPNVAVAYIDMDLAPMIIALWGGYFLLSWMETKSHTDPRFYIPGGFSYFKKMIEWLWSGFR